MYKLYEGIRSATARNNIALIGCNFVQGLHHGVFDIVYLGHLTYSTVGCLIDDASLAFAYNKNTLKRPIISCGAILDGQPKAATYDT